jgi:hypothetical protein
VLTTAACVERAWTSIPTYVIVCIMARPSILCGQPRPLLGQTNPQTDDEGLAARINPQPEPA